MKRLVLSVFALALLVPLVPAGELFIANYSGNRWDVEVFRTSDSGNVYPQRVISGAATLMKWPWGVAVDAQRIYVANYTLESTNLVTIYNLNDNGSNVTPARAISTEIGTLGRAIFVDATSIIVGTATSGILTFPVDASGVTAPTYRIYGQEIGMDSLGGMTADSIYIYAGLNSETGAVHVFRRTDDGIVAPQRTLRCAALNMRYIGAMAVDAQYLYVLSDPGTTTNQSIMVFDKTASGETLPLRRIMGSNTGLSDSMGIAVDSSYIYVTSRDRNCVRAYPINANGNVAAHHVISPEYPNPYLYATYGIAVSANSSGPDARVGPGITADGVRGAVTVSYPDPVAIAVGVNAGAYAGIPVDWFVAAVPDAGSEWFYLNAAGAWAAFPANNLAACRPALQGGIADISQPQVILNNYPLAPGAYSFFFIMDYPMDGVLNLIPGQYLTDTARVEVLNLQ
ncbi:MAG: hypothetical protein WC299_03480 [Kiritimatiellia bacterium]